MKKLFFRIAAILSLLIAIASLAHAQAAAPATGIRVLVYGIHYGGNIVYNYKVINNGDTPFGYFTIGSHFDSVEEETNPQLYRLPLGWSYGEEGETGTAIILAPGSTSQPAYWIPHVFGQQEDDRYYLNWHAAPGPVSNAIQPGQTLAGFSVTVPLVDNKLSLPAVTGQPIFTGPDEMYIKGGFEVGLVSGKDVWGTLERLDTTPPTLTVSLSPNTLWPPNEKFVPVTATITVKDDFDPAPEVQLISIIANEPLSKEDGRDIQPGTDDRQFLLKAKRKDHNKDGRIYTVTYTATDGTGNIATASATVTVPHDRKENKERREERNKKDKDERTRDR
jgi:hypothetical protein